VTAGKQKAAANNSDLLFLGAVVLCGLVLRGFLSSIDHVVWGDEPFYLWMGKNLADGHGLQYIGQAETQFTPLFPLVTAAVYKLTGNLAVGSMICYVLFGALLPVPVYCIARTLYGQKTGRIAAILTAIWPPLMTGVLLWGTMTEPIYLFLAYTGVWTALLAWKQNLFRWYALSGALFSLAYLTRGEGVAYAGVFFLLLLLLYLWERRGERRWVLPRLALFVAGFLIVASPYLVYLHHHTGGWTLSTNSAITYITARGLRDGNVAQFDKETWGLDSSGQEVRFYSDEISQLSTLDYVRADPNDFIRGTYVNLRRLPRILFSHRMFPMLMVLAVCVGWLKRAWDTERLKNELFLVASACPIMIFAFFFFQERYVAAALPPLIIWGAHGLALIGDWIADTVKSLWPKRGLLVTRLLGTVPTAVAILGCAVLAPVLLTTTSRGSVSPVHKKVGLWIKDHAQEGSVVMSRLPAFAFHADARWVPYPNADYAEVLRYGRAHDADYFVLDEHFVVTVRPQMAFLLEETSVADDLTLVHTDSSDPDRKVVVYSVNDASNR